MSNNIIINEILFAILGRLAKDLGKTSISLTFKDFELEDHHESRFDGMVLWAMNEGLIRVRKSDHLMEADTEFSYAVLHCPAITSLGLAVGALAIKQMDNDILLATAAVKHPGSIAAVNKHQEHLGR